MKKHGVGIIGYGWVAGAHITAINQTQQARVAAVWSSRPQDSSAVSKKHGCDITCHTDLKQMLKDPAIDVVSICSYPYQHADHAVAAARAGKHLIIEKPLALSWSDCKRIARAVDDAGVQTCICFECRFASQFLATRSIIDQGLLGKLHYGEVDYYHGIGPWYGQFRWNTKRDAGGSSLLSAGCHAMDALLLCMEGEVAGVFSSATASKNKTFKQYEYPTTSVSIVNFADGRVGKVASVIDCWQPYYFHTHLVGSEGSLLDNKFHSTQINGLNKHQWSSLTMKLLDSGDVSDHPYFTQFQAFFDSLDAGKKMPLTSMADALRTHQVIFAADASARTGKPVRIRA